ncbi:MAG: response regulator [Burkholderiales bacterium]|nr:response regulator [Burkholderiales bacterium]
MSDNNAYRMTDKGRSEVSARPGLLKPGLKGLLAAVGNIASAETLRKKFPKAGDIAAALAQLARDGYIEALPAIAAKPAAAKPAAAKPAPAVADDDLDMSSLFAKPPKEPTLHKLREAEGTISGTRRLKAGYQISIVNRPGRPLPARSGGKHGILLIDGHEAEALQAARDLMQAGFDVRGAATKAEIVRALGQKPLPDLIVMDVDLPDAVGLDLLGKLHEHPELKDTPILVVTARAERDDVVAALAYGASGYLNKPVKPEVLLRHIKDALGLP